MTSPNAASSHGHLLKGAPIHSSNLQRTGLTEPPTPTMPAPRLGTVRRHVADDCPASSRSVRFSSARPASCLGTPGAEATPTHHVLRPRGGVLCRLTVTAISISSLHNKLNLMERSDRLCIKLQNTATKHKDKIQMVSLKITFLKNRCIAIIFVGLSLKSIHMRGKKGSFRWPQADEVTSCHHSS